MEPNLIPPAVWWKKRPEIGERGASAPSLTSACGLERYKTMGRRPPVHITYHPSVTTSAVSAACSSEALLDRLEEAGLQCSLGREFEAGNDESDRCWRSGLKSIVVMSSDRGSCRGISHDSRRAGSGAASHRRVCQDSSLSGTCASRISGPCAVILHLVLALTREDVHVQRVLGQAIGLGKCIIPVLLEQCRAVNNDNMLDDPVVGSVTVLICFCHFIGAQSSQSYDERCAFNPQSRNCTHSKCLLSTVFVTLLACPRALSRATLRTLRCIDLTRILGGMPEVALGESFPEVESGELPL